MFMFAYAVVIIAIVGLFLQVTSALTLHFAAQQTALGQQLVSWQEMAVGYACTPTSGELPVSNTSTVGATTVDTGIRNQRSSYAGRSWNTSIFDGLYGGGSARVVLSYISPTATDYGGHGVGEVIRQFRKALKIQTLSFSTVYDGGTCPDRCINLVFTDSGSSYSIVISGLPTSGTHEVPLNVSAIAGTKVCP